MTLLNESRAVDLQIRWAELALESAQLQYDIAVSESSDGVLTESENEALFMEAEAAAQKSKNIIIRAIEKVIDFIKSVASKIAAAFSEKKVKSDLEEIKKIQNDPNVKAAKVEVPDWKDAEKNIDGYEKAIADAEKKAKAGKLTQADIDKMNDAKEKCKTRKKIVIGAAAGAVALGGAVLTYNKRLENLRNKSKNRISDINKLINDPTSQLDDADIDALNSEEEKIKDIAKTRQSLSIYMAQTDLDKLKAGLEVLYSSTLGKLVNAVKSVRSKAPESESEETD